ncbi:MAG: helix-turn-helix transcriptional regulator [Clostridia bacterium]|nr:helix-turn-helix transcriptional regulator [Clostridia bacterium]
MSTQTEISILCENVKRLRKREKLSKKEMARIMGVGVRSITMLENGVMPVRMKADVLGRLKWRFGVTIEELFSKIIETE